MQGRRWSDGLHQAVEAKEGVTIQNETVTIASVACKAFFKSYPKLGGMTGTAETEITEFSNIYELEVAVVPTNRPVSREDSTDVVFYGSEKGKWNAAPQGNFSACTKRVDPCSLALPPSRDRTNRRTPRRRRHPLRVAQRETGKRRA